MRAILPFLAIFTAVTGCSAGKDMELAQQEVARFHQMLDAGRFAEIYGASGAEIRRDMDQPQFVAFLTGVHTQFGPVTKTSNTGWHVNYGTSGNRVELTYDTEFARGKGQETFVFDLAGGKTTLAGYHIKSQ